MNPLFKPATGGMFGGIDLSKNSANKSGNSTQVSDKGFFIKPATGGTFGGFDLSKNNANKPSNSNQSSITIPLFKPISGGTFGGIKLDSQGQKSDDQRGNNGVQNSAERGGSALNSYVDSGQAQDEKETPDVEFEKVSPKKDK